MTDYEQNMEARWQRLQERLSSADTSNISQEVLHLVRAVAGVADPVMTCDECEDWLPSYVDAEIGGLSVGKRYPKVKRHLDLCTDCSTDYLQMLEWALEEEAIESHSVARIPTPNLSFLPPLTPVVPPVSLLDYVRSLVEELIGSLVPKRIGELQRMGDMFFRRIEAAGPTFAFQPTPVLSGEPNTVQYLVVTYGTTQKLAQEWSMSDVEHAIASRTLSERVREYAEEEARRHGFRKEDAKGFAEQYAEVVCEDLTALQGLFADE